MSRNTKRLKFAETDSDMHYDLTPVVEIGQHLLLVICGAVLHMFAFTLTHLNHVLYRCTIKTQEKLKGLLTAPFCSGILQLPNKLAVSVRRRLSKMSPDLDPNFDLSLKRKKKKKVIRKIITMIQLIIFPLVHDNQV